jgi:hypothetical protein
LKLMDEPIIQLKRKVRASGDWVFVLN